jgi:hypothetical protein
MIYKYYKFPSKKTMPPLNEWPEGICIEEVGLIKKTNEVLDEQGNEIVPPVYFDGWHVNVVLQGYVDLSFVQQYEIHVNTPRRLWFGQEI